MKKLVALLIVSLAFATAPAFAGFQEGMDAYQNGDYEIALREFHPLAEQGNVDAQFALGWMYKNGWGVSQDDKQALKWFRLSVKQGDAKGQYGLGSMYNKGQGVPQDYKEAFKLYTLSAEQGYVDAQYNLGTMHYNGDGVPQDYVLAHMWYNIAASNGEETAAENRDIIASLMTASQIEKAQDLARACVAKDYKGC